MVLCASVSTSFLLFLKDTSHVGLGAHHNSVPLQQSYFQIKLHSEVLGIRTSISLLWVTQSDHNRKETILSSLHINYAPCDSKQPKFIRQPTVVPRMCWGIWRSMMRQPLLESSQPGRETSELTKHSAAHAHAEMGLLRTQPASKHQDLRGSA